MTEKLVRKLTPLEVEVGKTYVVSVWSGSDYLAILREDGFHFADGTGWEDHTPMPDTILEVREWRGQSADPQEKARPDSQTPQS